MAYEHILVESRGAVGLVTLHRPEALNALCAELIKELAAALDVFEANGSIGAIVLTGSDKAFAAGADIKEMSGRSYMDVYLSDFITVGWERVSTVRKPTKRKGPAWLVASFQRPSCSTKRSRAQLRRRQCLVRSR